MKVVLTEGQMRTLLKEEVIMESLFHKGMSFDEILATVKSLAKNGLLTATLITNIILSFQLNHTQKQLLQQAAQTEQVAPKEDAVTPEKTREEKLANPDGKWKAIANDVTATVYNAVPSQCNNDVKHTASMFKLNLNDVLSHRIIAMERTMMKEYGLKYGDVVKIDKHIVKVHVIKTQERKLTSGFAKAGVIKRVYSKPVKFNNYDYDLTKDIFKKTS